MNESFGKAYESMYEGSLVGAGGLTFAVWGYVIAKQRPSREYGSAVDLNPVLMAAVLGETEEEVEAAIKFLEAPDPRSRTKEEDGRRLIRKGQFEYQVVNGKYYRQLRDTDVRRLSNRDAKRRERARQQGEE